MIEEAGNTKGGRKLLAHIREKYGSVPKFCETHSLDRLKVQRVINGLVTRIDVDWALRVQEVTDQAILVEDWASDEAEAS